MEIYPGEVVFRVLYRQHPLADWLFPFDRREYARGRM
jgi:hypothetical protein